MSRIDETVRCSFTFAVWRSRPVRAAGAASRTGGVRRSKNGDASFAGISMKQTEAIIASMSRMSMLSSPK